MRDDIGDIEAFYDESPEREHERLVEHQLEFELTLRLLRRHLRPASRLLDLGAATARYSVALARDGHRITAVDLSARLIERAREVVAAAGLDGPIDLRVGDARDLGFLGDATFDAVLVMGPLYHLVDAADRRLALTQVSNRLGPGGLVFSAFLSRFGVLGDFLRRMPDWIHNADEVASLMDTGARPADAPRTGGFRGYFATVPETIALHESIGFETVSLVGVEPAISADDESFNSLSGDARERWLDLFERVCDEPSTVGASRHLLYVGRKRDISPA